ncbi:hypothetical protein QLX08_005587 [Tetragonisca angustula]|uniref:Uncharacterized protein n=1 Tax=Tetragonisca angustula TaxID=166442 RepID=A0AAW1A0M4_9HYME
MIDFTVSVERADSSGEISKDQLLWRRDEERTSRKATISSNGSPAGKQSFRRAKQQQQESNNFQPKATRATQTSLLVESPRGARRSRKTTSLLNKIASSKCLAKFRDSPVQELTVAN